MIIANNILKQRIMKYLSILLLVLFLSCEKECVYKNHIVEDDFRKVQLIFKVVECGEFNIYSDNKIYKDCLNTGWYQYYIGNSKFIKIEYTGELDSVDVKSIYR